MEEQEFTSSNTQSNDFATELDFYRRISEALETLGEGSVKSIPGADRLFMSSEQLSYCDLYYKNVVKQPVGAHELMFIDSYCQMLKASPRSIAMSELLLNDDYIAKTYADMMARRNALRPDYNSPPSLDELFFMASREIAAGYSPSFSESSVDVFPTHSDIFSEITALAKGYSPVYTQNKICIAEKVAPLCSRKLKEAVIVYGGGDSSDELMKKFLSFTLSARRVNTDTAVLKTETLIEELISRYEEFSILSLALPVPKEGRFAAQNSFFNENASLKIANAFFTSEVFGDKVILIEGRKSTINALSKYARSFGLSTFHGIKNAPEKKKKNKRKKKSGISPLAVRINSSFFITLSELGNNIHVKLPDHELSHLADAEAIPSAECIYERRTNSASDAVFSSSLCPRDTHLPYHSAINSVVSALLSAAKSGANLSAGEMTLSISASLNFNGENAGRSLAILLGLYRVQVELPIKPRNMYFSLADGDSESVTVLVHVTSPHGEALDLVPSDADEFLRIHSDERGIPDFDLVRKILSGDKT